MRTLYVTCLVLALSASLATAADGDFDPTYGVFNSGKNVIGLDFGGTNNDVLSDMLLASDGAAFLVGTSTLGTGHTAVNLVKMTPQGLQDNAFSSHLGYSLFGAVNSDDYAARASLDAQGNIIIAATQPQANLDTGLLLYASKPNGDTVHFGNYIFIPLDFDLNGSVEDTAAAALHMPNGGYILAGTATTPAGTELAVGRFNEDGTPDEIFGGGTGKVHYSFPNAGFIEITSLAYHDGRLLVAGSSRSVANAPSSMFIARLHAITGAKDAGYGAGGACIVTFNEGVGNNDNAGITSLVVQNDDVYAGGYAQTDAGRYKGAVAKLTQNCGLDLDFGTNGRAFLNSGYTLAFNKIAVQGDGKVVAVGTRKQSAASDTRIDVARFKADGTLDMDFASFGENVFGFNLAGGGDTGVSIAVGSDRIYVAGYASRGAGNNDYVIAGLKNDLIFANNFED